MSKIVLSKIWNIHEYYYKNIKFIKFELIKLQIIILCSINHYYCILCYYNTVLLNNF